MPRVGFIGKGFGSSCVPAQYIELLAFTATFVGAVEDVAGGGLS